MSHLPVDEPFPERLARRFRWVYPERERVVCFLPGRDVSCLRRGQAVLIGDVRHVVTRIDEKRNRIKAKDAA